MAKIWINKAMECLKQSLEPIPHEMNEIDWKEKLSPDNKKLCQHLSAFANYPDRGFMVFGIEDNTAKLKGITKEKAEEIVLKIRFRQCATKIFLYSFCRVEENMYFCCTL